MAYRRLFKLILDCVNVQLIFSWVYIYSKRYACQYAFISIPYVCAFLHVNTSELAIVSAKRCVCARVRVSTPPVSCDIGILIKRDTLMQSFSSWPPGSCSSSLLTNKHINMAPNLMNTARDRCYLLGQPSLTALPNLIRGKINRTSIGNCLHRIEKQERRFSRTENRRRIENGLFPWN